MHRRLGFLAAVVMAAGPAAAAAVAQDLTIISKVTHDGGAPETRVGYMTRDHIRSVQGDGKEFILDSATGQMTVLDGTKKTYYLITRKDLDEMAAAMKERMNSPEMKKAQEAMERMSAEDRKKMEDVMGGMFAFNARKTGTRRKIAGYSCEDWILTMGQISTTEECLTSELQFPPQAWEMYRSFADSMKTMMAAFGPMAKNIAKMQEQFKQMRGYPLANRTTMDVMGHRSVTATEVVEIRRTPIPASAWEIPAGYTKVDNPMKKAFQGRKRR